MSDTERRVPRFHDHGADTPCGYMCKAHPNYETEYLKRNPVLRPKTSAERKGEPIHAGVLMYFPDAQAAKARLSVKGNIKHNPGEPLHWARGKSVDQLDACVRHLMNPDAIDPETGETELTAAAWRIDAMLQLQQERLLKEKGIMPYSGIAP